MIYNRRYSRWIRPILFIIDLLIIFLACYFFLSKNVIDLSFFLSFWILLSIFFSFYKVYRFTKPGKIISLISKQLFIFVLIIFTFYYINKSQTDYKNILKFFVISIICFNAWRIFLHYIFRKYRIITGSNYRQVVIIGENSSTKRLEFFFRNELEYGYRYLGFFSNKEIENRKGDIQDSFKFIKENNVDEVYCSIKELSDKQIKEYIDFCDTNFKSLKFIPDSKEIFTKNLHLNYYGITPILSLREIPLDNPINSIIKRTFDVVFALFVICFVLSWLIPILGLFIVLESKGPIFFRQNRPGIKEQGFGCYKFRSMSLNTRSEESATRNDARVTKVGKFIRRTSIDELPQFFNVLFGSMSVVGPRPHLWKQNEMYGTKISKYMIRHLVKPGVTGLAQVNGYRGEIETKPDIVNRTKYDIFYIENWSLLMDINIIVKTISNVLKGEDKAY